MSTEFGTLDFAVSFNRQTAFPLDARSYFETLAAAQAAAAKAEEAGSSNTVYYYGQTVAVVENGKATLYVIQPDKTLSKVAGGEDVLIKIDENQFKFDAEGKLSIVGVDAATEGQVLTVGADGILTWTTPIDAYTKSEVDNKIAAADHLKRKIVESVDQIDKNADDAMQYIYMVPTGLEEDQNKFYEYMVLELAGQRVIEKVGSWEVDLSDYVKKEALAKELAKKVDVVEGSRLITEAEASKWNESEKNFIASVSSDFTVSGERELSLNDLAISKVSGLQEALNSKINTDDTRLLSETDKSKLEKLTVDEAGNLVVEGKIDVTNVNNLTTWLAKKAGTTTGLSENNFSNDLYNKLNGLLNIKSVNIDELIVSDEGQLGIVAVDNSKVTGLDDLLSTKASIDSVAEVKTSLSTLQNSLNAMTTTVDKLSADVDDINSRLTWQNIAE